jgi:peptide/nickel transport system substrate-binding protein
MTETSNAIDAARLELGDVENALLDDLLTGRIDRRIFLRHATRLGIGLPLLRVLTAATGLGFSPHRAAAASPVAAGSPCSSMTAAAIS